MNPSKYFRSIRKTCCVFLNGDGVNLGFFRCEGAHIVKKTVWESQQSSTTGGTMGALVRDGAIVC